MDGPLEIRLQKILDIWTEEGQRMLREKTFSGDDLGSRNLVEVIDALSAAKEMLGQNINPKMVMEKIILKI